jgi:decaprenyl-phosphate phosphoribosyltransferase
MSNLKSPSDVRNASGVLRPSLQGHLEITRVDHWFKNVFVLPGIVTALSMSPPLVTAGLPLRIVVGLLAICLVASSNYVLNEVLDAPFDRHHPTKWQRPVPSGRVNIRLAYVQWLVLMIVGVGLGLTISMPYALTVLALWGMGCVYNIPPVRSKDAPYVDVLSEAVNNPLRMLAGWFIAGTGLVPPVSLLLSYWMVGCYFMALKRFAEYRDIRDRVRAAAYRKSFAFYSEERLLVSVVFYGSTAMLFFGAFIMRYRLELILSFPLVALVMAVYFALAFQEDSAAQRPEELYREPRLMAAVVACTVLMGALLFIDIPVLYHIFLPTAEVSHFGGTP